MMSSSPLWFASMLKSYDRSWSGWAPWSHTERDDEKDSLCMKVLFEVFTRIDCIIPRVLHE